MGDARHHRYPQSPRQLSKPGRCGAFGWKRDVGAAQRGRLGGAFRLAAGPGLWPRSGERWRDDAPDPPRDRKSVVEGKSVSVRVDIGGRRIIKKKKHIDINVQAILTTHLH